MSTTLAELAIRCEQAPVPSGDGERVSGWGVMALTFASGHVLAFRRWTASSIGPGYSSVWHRDPAGRWRMWQTVQPDLACPRYFSAAIDHSHVDEIQTTWEAPRQVTIRIPGTVEWTLHARRTAATTILNAAMTLMPGAAWNSPRVLRTMGPVAGPALRAGRIALTGSTPNGYRFRMAPQRLWVVDRSRAIVDGLDLGPIAPLSSPTRLGDFLIPQRGIVALGEAAFDVPVTSNGIPGSFEGP